MANRSISAWKITVTTALRQDPKKTGVLGVLVVVLLVSWARMMVGQSRPAAAAGSLVAQTAGSSQISVPSPSPKLNGSAASLREWLSGPIPPIKRNIFLVKSEYFPADATENKPTPATSGFWASLGKSLSVQADQREKRDAAIASLKVEAATLHPTSIAMGPLPRAMINGTLVGEGDSIGSFRVLRIEPRGIIVEHERIRLAIPMGVNAGPDSGK